LAWIAAGMQLSRTLLPKSMLIFGVRRTLILNERRTFS
jgi:hypothetical protein